MRCSKVLLCRYLYTLLIMSLIAIFSCEFLLLHYGELVKLCLLYYHSLNKHHDEENIGSH